MNEAYLHHIWKMKRLPFHALKTVDGKSISILHTGIHNSDSGPDFFNGQIELEGVVYVGNIELHIKSSDWYAHQHQHDRTYDNVILHVVYEHNQEVSIKSQPIPTIELKSLIDWDHFYKMDSLHSSNSSIPCSKLIDQCNEPVFWNQIEHALVNRIERKIETLQRVFNSSSPDPRKVLFYSISHAFGMKTNATAFEELAQRIPFEKLIKASKKGQEALIFGASGMLEKQVDDSYHQLLQSEWRNQQYRLSVHPARAEIWKFKGCRPAGFPTLRLAQFAAFTNEMDWSSAFWELPVKDIKAILIQVLTADPSSYWKNQYDFGKSKAKPTTAQLSIASSHLILINGIVPFLGWLSVQTGNSVFREKAFELLEMIPPEINVHLDKWRLLRKTPKSASDSQGLIEQISNWCEKKKCLNCAVGIQLFKQL